MLKQTIRSAGHMRDEFQRYGRADQFSYQAYDVLFDWYWDLGEDMGTPVEFDVIGICCDWGEYDSAAELAADYDISLEDLVDPADIPDMDDGEIEEAYAEELNNYGVLLRVEGGSVLFSE
jgi:hypothetical protein